MTRISIHDVKGIKIKKFQMESGVWVKHVDILTADGNDVELTLFSEDSDNLNVRRSGAR